MKRLFLFLLCLLVSIGGLPATALAAPAWPSGVSIEADGGILMDADTGTILYGKNMDQPYYPASITKILTAMIVLEQCSLDEIVEFSYDDVYNVEAGSSSAGIDEGDRLTVRDCLYALMLASANESANALACHVSGSREAFAELMNERAASLGCTGSNFANPSGLNDENHYTTARDMALITREAIKNPVFLEINATRSYQLAPTKRSPEGGYVANHHRMLLKNEAVYYPGAFAGKTGYTSLAGNTLVTCSENNGMTLIAVVLNGHQSHYTDTKALFDFGFDNFQSLKAADYETTYRSLENDMTIGGMTARDSISLELDPEGRVIIPKSADFSDTQSSLSYNLSDSDPSDAIAVIGYTYGDHPVGQVYLQSPGLHTTGEAAAGEITAREMTDGEITDGEITDGEMTDGEETGTARISPASQNSLTESSGPSAAAPSGASEGNSQGDSQPDTFPWALVTAGGALAALIGIIALIFFYRRKKEEEAMLLRRQRRLERLEDIGYSSADFDRLVAQRRSSSGYSSKKGRRRRKKSFFR